MTMHLRLTLALATCMTLLFSCNRNHSTTPASTYYQERHRPQYHFSPEANWMNDPNGMVYLDGEYHLFYQYYPDSTVWGPMHWGHAVSTDLNHWQHLPTALYPDSLGWIFSGSAVYDRDNTSGFGTHGKGPLVAIFTHHNPDIERSGSDTFQYQSIAYSTDKGRSWTKYEDNPVVSNPGIRDFRDPKVIWYPPSKKWIMTVAALDHVQFYESPDLKQWSYLSDFGKGIGSHDGVWECPDLFPLSTADGVEYWVLLQNMNPGNPNGGSGLQYFIGHFDGRRFEVDTNFMSLLSARPAHYPPGQLFADFELDYSGWAIRGTAFGDAPTNATKSEQQGLTGYEGTSLASSLSHGSDVHTGELISPEFTISSDFINFKIGGGNHRGRTFIALEVDGLRVREAEGNNTKLLGWKGWNVSAFYGKKARIKIIDNHSGPWGHILVDQISFSDQLAHEELSGSVWLDAGRDNYAGVTWDNTPDIHRQRQFIGWMSNWAYAQVVPTERWRSAMTLPWTLTIEHVDGIPRLIGNPILAPSMMSDHATTLIDQSPLPASGLARIAVSASHADADVRISLSNDHDERIDLSYDPSDHIISMDRRRSGDGSFSPDFLSISTARRIAHDSPISFDIYIDHSSIEVFVDGGKNVFSEIFFPTQPYSTVTVHGAHGTLQEIKKTWK